MTMQTPYSYCGCFILYSSFSFSFLFQLSRQNLHSCRHCFDYSPGTYRKKSWAQIIYFAKKILRIVFRLLLPL